MRDWADEPFVKLYTRENADQRAMPYEARSLLMHLLKEMDRAGFLDLGRRGLEALPGYLRAEHKREEIGEAIRYLLEDDGCLTFDGRVLHWPNYMPAQAATQTDKARQRRSREKANAEASAAAREREMSRPAVTVGHATDVTPSRHALTSRGVTPSHETRRSDQTRSDQREALAGADAPDPQLEEAQKQDKGEQDKPSLGLGPGSKAKTPRTKSAAELWVDWWLELRAEKTETFDQPWAIARINKQVTPLLIGLSEAGLKSAARAFLADAYYGSTDPQWPLGALVARAGEYRQKAEQSLRHATGTPPKPKKRNENYPDVDPYQLPGQGYFPEDPVHVANLARLHAHWAEEDAAEELAKKNGRA